jgi:hypothetical protein
MPLLGLTDNPRTGALNGSYLVSKNAVLHLVCLNAALDEKGRRAEGLRGGLEQSAAFGLNSPSSDAARTRGKARHKGGAT